MSRRALVVVVMGLVLVMAVGWNAGELHRENCLHQGRRACSVLPWENGRPAPAAKVKPPAECVLYGQHCP